MALITSELMLLQDVEEVLALKNAIFRQVRAMNHVAHSILAETCSKRRLRIDFFAYLRVSGLRCLAISGSWGPHSSLNDSTAFSYLISSATTGPLEKCSITGKYSGSTPL